jgi:hypothetical protein
MSQRPFVYKNLTTHPENITLLMTLKACGSLLALSIYVGEVANGITARHFLFVRPFELADEMPQNIPATVANKYMDITNAGHL